MDRQTLIAHIMEYCSKWIVNSYTDQDGDDVLEFDRTIPLAFSDFLYSLETISYRESWEYTAITYYSASQRYIVTVCKRFQ